MRTVLVANTFSGGGLERQAVLLYRELRRRSLDCLAVCLEDSVGYLTEEERAGVVSLRRRGRVDTARVAWQLRGLVGDGDAVIGFNWYPSAVAWMARPRALRVMRFGGLLDQDGVWGYRHRLATWAARDAAAIIGCSWGVTRDAMERLRPMRALCGRIENAVHLGPGPGEVTAPPVVSRPYLLHVGRLEPIKDQTTLMEAFAKVADRVPHDLVIAGAGSRRADLVALSEDLGVGQRVRFLGFVDDTRALYEHASIAVFTSRTEGFGTVIVEALASGTPVVSTDAKPGPREALLGHDPRMWRLVRVGDVQGVATAMLDLLQHRPDPAVRSEAAERIRSRYSIERAADGYLELLAAASMARAGQR